MKESASGELRTIAVRIACAFFIACTLYAIGIIAGYLAIAKNDALRSASGYAERVYLETVTIDVDPEHD